jgi:AcrR family transcriptional regulator
MNTQRRPGSREQHQLPPGPHGFSRSFVARNQRDRILMAVADATSERGYAQASVEDIIARAGVSRRTFYDLFKNKEDAFLAAYDEAVRRFMKSIRDDRTAERDFASRMTAGLRAFLELLAGAPSFARMCIVEVLAAGPEAVRRRNDAMTTLSAMIEDDARRLSSRPQSPVAVEMLVGGIYELVYSRLAAGRVDEIERLLPEVVYATLAPYLGERAAAAARHELLGNPGSAKSRAASAA